MTDNFDTEALNIDTEALDPLEVSEADLEQYAPRTVEELNTSLPQYEFLELIAVGGMGAIYKALQPKLDRLIAVKLLPKMVNDKFGFAERFSQEAKAMAKLSHPHIVPIFDFGETNQGQAYFVMEFVEGADLLRYLHGGQLTLAHFFGWIPQVCSAIQYAHNHDIVHRDIKPANILIDKEGNVKMADFGLAKLTGAQPVRDSDEEDSELEENADEVSMGTPGYAAPEQFGSDSKVDSRADIYSLGVVMYQMLTGGMPVGAFPMPSEVNPHVDIRVDEVVMRAMQQDPNERFQTISEISERLTLIRATENDVPVETKPEVDPAITPSGKRLITGAVQTISKPKRVSATSSRPPAASGKVAIPAKRAATSGKAVSLNTGRVAKMPIGKPTSRPTENLRRSMDKKNTSISPFAVFAIIAAIVGIIYVVVQSGHKTDAGTPNGSATSNDSTQTDLSGLAASGNSTTPVKEPVTNPNTEAGQRLAEMVAVAMETYDSRVNVPYDESIERLNELFLTTLNTQQENVADLENPELTAAYQAEIDRFTNGETPQPSENADLPKKIRKMRVNYIKKLKSYKQEQLANIKLFEGDLDSKFKKLQDNYSLAQNNDAAREVEYYRTNRKRWVASRPSQQDYSNSELQSE